MTTSKDLSKLQHSLVNAPLHFYYEVKNDGTSVQFRIECLMGIQMLV